MEAVFHISRYDSEQWERVLGNIPNLLDDPTVDCERIVLVVNSGGIEFLRNKSEYADDISRLLDRRLDISACSNTLDNSNMTEEDLHLGVDTVPSAMGELVRLQNDGYAYINP